MRSSDILDLADTLLKNVDIQNKPMLCNIIGRSYYSCFHKLREVAKDQYKWNETNDDNLGSHERMISRIDNNNLSDNEKIKLLFSVKNNIITLKKKRILADYNYNDPISKLDAAYCVTTAKEIFKKLDSI